MGGGGEGEAPGTMEVEEEAEEMETGEAFLWFGIHRGLWPHTRAATKQLKTSSSRAQLAPVSWFSQNVKYKCSKLKLH